MKKILWLVALKSEPSWPKSKIDYSKALNVPENGISYDFKDELKWFFTIVFSDGLEVSFGQSYPNSWFYVSISVSQTSLSCTCKRLGHYNWGISNCKFVKTWHELSITT